MEGQGAGELGRRELESAGCRDEDPALVAPPATVLLRRLLFAGGGRSGARMPEAIWLATI